MPREFDYPCNAGTQLWTAWRMNPDSLWTRNNHYLQLVGKLAPAKTSTEARSQIVTLDRRWMTDFPETYNPKNPLKGDITPISDAILGSTRPYLARAARRRRIHFADRMRERRESIVGARSNLRRK